MKNAFEKNKEIKLSVVFSGFLIFTFTLIILAGILLYGFGVNNSLLDASSKIIPYPAAFWGTDLVSIKDLNRRLVAAKRFYENQSFDEIGIRIDFSTVEGKKRLKIKERKILTKMIEDKIIEKEANRRGIALSAEDITQELNEKLKESGSEEQLKNDMQKLYNWTLEDFKENIIKPDLYENKLFELIRNDSQENFAAKEKIQSALLEFEKGNDFERIVEKYSDGESAKTKGDLGWIDENQILPEIATIVFETKKGQTTSIIESRLGYHIIKLNDQKTEDGIRKANLSQIFIKTHNLADWLSESEKNLKIIIPLKDFYWDNESQSVEFSSKELKNFEENLIKNSPDDLSVIF
jgi:parvulin-like peptidyl-prolyl isomerase